MSPSVEGFGRRPRNRIHPHALGPASETLNQSGRRRRSHKRTLSDVRLWAAGQRLLLAPGGHSRRDAPQHLRAAALIVSVGGKGTFSFSLTGCLLELLAIKFGKRRCVRRARASVIAIIVSDAHGYPFI